MANPQVSSELLPWLTKRFREYEIPWTKAAESLTTDEPLVEIRSNKDGTRWTVYSKATEKIAIFSHAGIWSWASPPQTGNFVPEGEVPPEGIHASRIMPVLSKKIETSYAFNTEDEPSFYDCAKIFENHALGLKDFNKWNKDRRTWQLGDTAFARRRFILSSRLVLRRTPAKMKEAMAPLPYQLHPWLADAIQAQKYQMWMANPEMPAILEYDAGKLQMLKPTTNRYFESGDIVWFSFALSFDVNSNNWMPEYKPLDFIRVGNLPQSSEGSDYSLAESVGSAYQSLTSGSATLYDDGDHPSMTTDDDLLRKGIFALNATFTRLNKDTDLKRSRDGDGDDTMSDAGSDKSAYSAQLAALEELAPPAKRAKIEDVPPKTISRTFVAVDDIPKRKSGGKINKVK